MNAIVLLLIYLCMAVFDSFVLAGTAYLVGWCGWSAWWFVLAFLMCAGSNPRKLILAWQGIDAKEAA